MSERIDLAAVELPPEGESPAPSRLRLVLALVALAELALAVTLARGGAASGAWCPGEGSSWGCGTLFRPRLAALGPTSVATLAVLGASLTLGAAWYLLFRGAGSRLARRGAPLLAALAGFALGIQLLAWRAQGALCPPCLGLASLALASAGLAAAVVRRETGGGVGASAATLALAFALTAPLAWWRGGALAVEDAGRIAAARAAGGSSGPRLLLFEREGCPYCQALLADALGDPTVLPLLERTRGLESVLPGDPRVEALSIPGAPVLVLVDEQARELARFKGHGSAAEVEAWLAGALR